MKCLSLFHWCSRALCVALSVVVLAAQPSSPPIFAPSEISKPREPGERSYHLDWTASPGTGYHIQYTDQLQSGALWKLLNPEPITPTNVAGSITLDLSASPVRFYRVVEVDTEPPKLEFIYPVDGLVAVERDAVLLASITDEHLIAPDTLSLTLPSGESIGLADPRLAFANDLVQFQPGAGDAHGGPGATVRYSLRAADTLGNASEDLSVEFRLAVEPVLVKGAAGLGTPPRTVQEKNLGSAPANVILEASENQVKVLYSGTEHGFRLNQPLWSYDARYPYYWKVTGIADDPATRTVTLETELIGLEELFEAGSFNLRQAVEIDPETGGPLENAALQGRFGAWIPLVTHKAPLNDKELFRDSVLHAYLDTGLLDFSTRMQIAGEIRSFRFEELQIIQQGRMDLGLIAVLETKRAVAKSNEDKPKELFSRQRWFRGQMGPVPVWIKLVFDVTASLSFEAEGRAGASVGFAFDQITSWGIFYDRDDERGWRIGGPGALRPKFAFRGSGPQLEAGLNSEVQLEAKLNALINGVAGVSASLVPFMELAAEFQAVPLAYEWGLDAGLKSEVANEVELWHPKWGELPSKELFHPIRHRIAGGKHPDHLAWLQPLQDFTVTEGAPFALNVQVNGNAAATEFSWTVDGKPLLGATRPAFGRSRAREADAGRYVVTATRGEESISSAASLKVQSLASAPPSFSRIPAGAFEMGAPRRTQTVTISRDFYMHRTEITWARWDSVRQWALQNGYPDLPAGAKSHAVWEENARDDDKDGRHPVTGISWHDSLKWLNAWSERDGLVPCYRVDREVYRTGGGMPVQCDWEAAGYRLPTEAEWEYACRAGTATEYYTGDRDWWEGLVVKALYRAGWYRDNARASTRLVAQMEPNAWGLYDTHGNVSEWCWNPFSQGQPRTEATDPGRTVTSGHTWLALRGGNIWDPAGDCRSFSREPLNPNTPASRYGPWGFRAARNAQ